MVITITTNYGALIAAAVFYLATGAVIATYAYDQAKRENHLRHPKAGATVIALLWPGFVLAFVIATVLINPILKKLDNRMPPAETPHPTA